MLLIQSKGIDPSTLVNRVIALFLDLPEDPREKLIQQQSEEMVIRLRIQYEREIRDRIREYATEQAAHDRDRAARAAAEKPILEFGALLQQTSQYPQALLALQSMRHEAPCWETILDELGARTGRTWEFTEMWNTAIEWYRRYGSRQHATT
jgi:hypothetical protein